MSRRCSSTNIEGIGAVIIPPTMGAAILRMTSEPVPPPNMIGRSPAMITVTAHCPIIRPGEFDELG